MSGPTGTGKSVNILGHLQHGLPDRFVPITLNFSAQTSANQTQDLIDSKCEKRRKGVYGPSAGKQFIIFVDDVNMPMKEEYGAQPPIEILRQWFDNAGWYDRKELVMKKIVDVLFVAACGPPGGGRNSITERAPPHDQAVARCQTRAGLPPQHNNRRRAPVLAACADGSSTCPKRSAPWMGNINERRRRETERCIVACC